MRPVQPRKLPGAWALRSCVQSSAKQQSCSSSSTALQLVLSLCWREVCVLLLLHPYAVLHVMAVVLGSRFGELADRPPIENESEKSLQAGSHVEAVAQKLNMPRQAVAWPTLRHGLRCSC